MNRYLIIDADYLVYTQAVTHEQDIDFGDGFGGKIVDFDAAWARVREAIDLWHSAFDAQPVICIGDRRGQYFRNDIWPTYKANRGEPLELVGQLREALIDEYYTKAKPGLEGEDVAGILLTSPRHLKGKKMIIGVDKDLLTLPGWHYNPMKGQKFYVYPHEADWWTAYQTLVGDVTDGFPGCKWSGPGHARRHLECGFGLPLKDLWHLILEAFIDLGHRANGWNTASMVEGSALWHTALTQLRLARILRYEDYDFDKQEVKLWTP